MKPALPCRFRWLGWCLLPCLTVAVGLTGCGGGTTPTGPSAPTTPQSFLTGVWHGTVTIQLNPEEGGTAAPLVGTVEWTFEVTPQTDLRSFTSTLRSQHPWLPGTMTGTTTLVPQNVPPTQISTQGSYDSARGCRGTYASSGTAEAARIDATFTGVDCNHTTFTGRVVLTKG